MRLQCRPQSPPKKGWALQASSTTVLSLEFQGHQAKGGVDLDLLVQG